MLGGHGHRKFYLNEVDRIESEYHKTLPEIQYTSEEIQAGFDSMARTFGFFSTLLFVEKESGINRNEILKWPVKEFKNNMTYLAWQGFTMKKHNEIMSKKKA